MPDKILWNKGYSTYIILIEAGGNGAMKRILSLVLVLVIVLTGIPKTLAISTEDGAVAPKEEVETDKNNNGAARAEAVAGQKEYTSDTIEEVIDESDPEREIIEQEFSVRISDPANGRSMISGTAPQESELRVYAGENCIFTTSPNRYGDVAGSFNAPECEDPVLVLRVDCEKDGVIQQQYCYLTIAADAPALTGFRYYSDLSSEEYVDLLYAIRNNNKIEVFSSTNEDPLHFEVEYTNPGQIGSVYVVAVKNDIRYRLEAVYDEAEGFFVAEGFFDETGKKFSPDKICLEYALASHPDRTLKEVVDIGNGSAVHALVEQDFPLATVEHTVDDSGALHEFTVCLEGATRQSQVNVDSSDIKKYMKYSIKAIDYTTGLEFYDYYQNITGAYAYVVPGLNDDKYIMCMDFRGIETEEGSDSFRTYMINSYQDGLDLVQEAYEIGVSCYYTDQGLEIPVRWTDYAEALGDASKVAGTIAALNGIYMDTKDLKKDIESSAFLSMSEKEEAYKLADELQADRMAYTLIATALPLIVASGGMAAPAVLFSGMLSVIGFMSDRAFDHRQNLIRNGSTPVDWNNDLGSATVRTTNGFSCQIDYRCVSKASGYSHPPFLYPHFSISMTGSGVMNAPLGDVLVQLWHEIVDRYSSHDVQYYCIDLFDVGDGITGLGPSLWGNWNRPSVFKLRIPDCFTVLECGGNFNTRSAGPSPEYDLYYRWTESIPAGVLTQCKIESIVLPDTLKRIEDGALACSRIKELDIPASVEYIGDGALACDSIKELDIPASVEYVGEEALGGPALEKVIFRSDFETNGTVFSDRCSKLKSIGPFGGDYDIQYTWTEKVPDYFCYSLDGLETVYLDSRISEIGKNAFSYCYDLKEFVTDCAETLTIGDNAFSSCSSLERIHFSAEQVKICPYAFRNCTSLNSVYAPYSIRGVSQNYWGGYSTSTNCVFPDSPLYTAGPAQDFDGGYNITFEWQEKVPDYYFCVFGTIKDVTLPEGVKEIGSYAFYRCSSLEEFELPETLTSIETDAFSYSGLSSVRVPDSVQYLGPRVFDGSKVSSVILPARLNVINGGLFADCPNLKSIVIPDTVTIIGNAAFYDSGLEEVNLPAGLQKIDNYAFEGAPISEIVFPEGLQEIGTYAFSETGLQEVKIPDSVEKIGNYAFAQSLVSSTTWPSGVTTISPGAFQDCEMLKSFAVPEGVRRVGAEAFAGSGLESVTLASTLEEIEYYAFQDTPIAEIIFPASLQKIGSDAFQDCMNLKKVVFLGDQPEMYEWTFSDPDFIAYYPAGNATWNVKPAFGENDRIVWVESGSEPHEPDKTGWQYENGEWYYYKEDGSKLTNGWAKDSTGWMYMDSNGRITKNKWIKDNGEWYYLKSNGYMAANEWTKDSSGWMYMDNSGKITKNKWIKDNGEWYYLKSNGYMAANEWTKDSTGWMYMDNSGKITKNKWIKDNGEWYYLKSNGYMAANEWAKDSGGWMYMDGSGKITKSKWVQYKGDWYYLKADGYMATGTLTISGKTYSFDSSGKWIK